MMWLNPNWYTSWMLTWTPITRCGLRIRLPHFHQFYAWDCRSALATIPRWRRFTSILKMWVTVPSPNYLYQSITRPSWLVMRYIVLLIIWNSTRSRPRITWSMNHDADVSMNWYLTSLRDCYHLNLRLRRWGLSYRLFNHKTEIPTLRMKGGVTCIKIPGFIRHRSWNWIQTSWCGSIPTSPLQDGLRNASSWLLVPWLLRLSVAALLPVLPRSLHKHHLVQ